MTAYKYDTYEIKRNFQLKAILAFMIKSVSCCFLIYYIYTTHAIVVKHNEVRTRNRCFGSSTLCSSHYVRYPTHTMKIFCQKESRLVVIPFAANDAFRITSLKFTPGYFLSILGYAFDLTVLFIWRKFHPQKVYWSMVAVEKIIEF